MDSRSIVARFRREAAEPSENLRYFSEDVAPILERMLTTYSTTLVEDCRSTQKPWEATYTREKVKAYSDAEESNVFGGLFYGGTRVLSFGATLYLEEDTMIIVNVMGTGASTVWRSKTESKVALKPGHGNAQADAESAMALIEQIVTNVLRKG
jgi:hypothetical protein